MFGLIVALTTTALLTPPASAQSPAGGEVLPDSTVADSTVVDSVSVRAAPDSTALSAPPSRSATRQPATTGIQSTDLLKIREIGNVSLSPDGRTVVYTVRSIAETPGEDAPYAYRTHLWFVPANGRDAARPLTRGTLGGSDPAWHPDSDRIAFVRPVDGTPQVFILPLTGGAPYQLTNVDHGATEPRWAPNGRDLLFASDVPADALARRLRRSAPSERPGRTPQDTLRAAPPDTLVVLRDTTTFAPVDTLSPALGDSLRLLSDSLGLFRDTVTVPVKLDLSPDPNGSLLQVRRWLARNQSANDPIVTTRLDFQGERALDPAASYRHYFRVRVPDGVLTGDPPQPSPQRVTGGFRSFYDAEWLPAGRQIVVSAPPDSNAHPDRIRERNLYLVDTRRGTTNRLLQIENHRLTDPTVTRDGTTLAFRATDLREAGFAQAEIGLFALDGRTKPQIITADFDRSPGPPKWSPDGWYLYTTAASDGGFPLIRFAPFKRSDSTDAPTAPPVDADGGPVSADRFAMDSTLTRTVPRERLTAFTRGIRSFDATDATVVYAATEVANPSALYTNTAGFRSERALHDPNADWLRTRRIVQPEPFTVTRDSVEIDGWVMRPDVPDNVQVPLLVQIHGGPMAMWGPGEATMWHEFQTLVSRGFGIVYANPRGSGGYGAEFRKGNFRNWGPGPAADVLAAADYAANLPWTDPDRQVVTGGSYGGYLTAWIVSQTDRFDAAVAQRGVYDLPTFLGEGNAWRLVPWHFGGYPWDGNVPPPAGHPDTTRTVASPPAPGSQSSTADSNGEGDDAPPVRIDTTVVDTSLSPRAVLMRNSPQTYAHRIRTPLLILHADDDLRTGVSQSEMLYRTLKILGRPVEYVRYPNAGHDLSRTGAPHQRLDRILRIYEFLARYTGDVAPTTRAEPEED